MDKHWLVYFLQQLLKVCRIVGVPKLGQLLDRVGTGQPLCIHRLIVEVQTGRREPLQGSRRGTLAWAAAEQERDGNGCSTRATIGRRRSPAPGRRRRLEVAVGYNAVAPPPRPLWFCRSSSTSGTVSGTWEPLPVPRTRLPAWRQVATPRIAHRFLSGLDKPCRHVGVRLAVPCGPSLKPNRVGQALPLQPTA